MPQNRSAGVTVIAILALIGSALLLAMAGLIAIVFIAAPNPPPNDAQLPPAFFKFIRIIAPLLYALPAIWGIITAVGLLQLKNWARISTLVFCVLLIVFGAFGGLTSIVFFLKPPPTTGVDPRMFSVMGAFTAAFAVAQVGIGVWWMVFFNRAKVKAQFLPQPPVTPQFADPYAVDPRYSTLVPPPGFPSQTDVALPPTPPIAVSKAPARPLSISIIGWFMLVSCLFIPINIYFHPPLTFFLTILTGWGVIAFMLISAALHLYTGIALLRMKDAGRLVACGYFIFSLVNIAVFYFAPGRSTRVAKLLALERSVFPWIQPAQANPVQSDMAPFLFIGAIGGVVFCLVLVYFLAAAKPAFDRAAQQG